MERKCFRNEEKRLKENKKKEYKSWSRKIITQNYS